MVKTLLKQGIPVLLRISLSTESNRHSDLLATDLHRLIIVVVVCSLRMADQGSGSLVKDLLLQKGHVILAVKDSWLLLVIPLGHYGKPIGGLLLDYLRLDVRLLVVNCIVVLWVLRVELI